ncbi:hypothetical protein HY449_01915 [Candidatus Pacearchaeota archaeon]|nr:hypothetical protein [Candidatus Pacearchaeota archaeon]
MKYWFMLVFILFALGSSVVLAFEPLSEICNVEQGCSVIQNSTYAYMFGIKNSVYGVGIFSLLSLAIIIQIFKPNNKNEKLIRMSLFVGMLIAIYFLSLQIFVLKAYCKYCLVADFSVIIAFGISLFEKKIKFV